MNILEHFPPIMTPRPGQVEALARIDEAFKSGQRYFVYEGPTGAGKSAVAKAILNCYGTGIITSPVNTLVGQYANDPKLAPLPEVRGKNAYECSVFSRADFHPNCEEAEDAAGWKAHSDRCADYIAARNFFWQSPQSVTNVHYLYCAPAVEGAYWPRKVLIIDEAHNLEATLIKMGERSISSKRVQDLGGKPFDFPTKPDKALLDTKPVAEWLAGFSSHLGHVISRIDDGHGTEAIRRKRQLQSLREGIDFTLQCGEWIAWFTTNTFGARILNITPMTAYRAAAKLFRGFDHVLFASATIGNVEVFLRGLGIERSKAGVHRASCDFPPENRPIYWQPKGSLAKSTGQAGFPPIMQAIREVLQRHPHERGILHCHSNALRDRILSDLKRDFGTRLITHGQKQDRDAGIERLRISRSGVLVSIAMTEGVSLDDDDARFCIFPKVPWGDMGDPYVKARMQRDDEWYANQAAIAIVQGSGRIVRHAEDRGETYIFDSSFGRLLRDATFPEWWLAALTGKKPAHRVTTAALSGRKEEAR